MQVLVDGALQFCGLFGVRFARLCVLLPIVTLSAYGAELPVGWEQLSDGDLVATASSYFSASPPPSGGDAPRLVRHLWGRFFSSEGNYAALSQEEFLALYAVLRTRESWIAEGEQGRAGPNRADVSKKLMSARIKVQKDLLERLRGGNAVGFDTLGAAWERAFIPGNPRRNPILDTKNYRLRSEAYGLWMEQNNWRNLSIEQLSELAVGLSADRISHAHFSVRWTGLLVPPGDGQYRFRQLRQCAGDGQCRVFLAGKTVLDTRDSTVAFGRRLDESFVGAPIPLVANRPIEIVAEYAYDRTAIRNALVDGVSVPVFPLMVLMWEREGGSPEIIPASAYQLPTELANQAEHGLQSEYFSKVDFQESIGTKLDAGICLLGARRPILPVQNEKHTQVLAHLSESMLGIPYFSVENGISRLSDVSPQQWRPDLGWQYVEFSSQIDGWNRLAMLNWCLSEADPASITPQQFVGLYQNLSLFSSESRLGLLRRWGRAWPRPQLHLMSTPDNIPRENEFTDRELFYLLGRWLGQNHIADLDELVEHDVVEESGFPQLQFACIAAAKLSRVPRREGELLQLAVSKLDDPRLTADQRAAWLCMQGWCEEILAGDPFYRGLGIPRFEAAAATAVDPDWKFYGTREVIARLISKGGYQQAMESIEVALKQFSDPSQVAELNRCRAEAIRLNSSWGEFFQDRAIHNQQVSRQHEVAQLKIRLEKATERGDSAAMERYQQQIDRLK